MRLIGGRYAVLFGLRRGILPVCGVHTFHAATLPGRARCSQREL